MSADDRGGDPKALGDVTDLFDIATWQKLREQRDPDAPPPEPKPPAELVYGLKAGILTAEVTDCPNCNDGWAYDADAVRQCPVCGPLRAVESRINRANLPALPEASTFDGFEVYCLKAAPEDPPGVQIGGVIYEAGPDGSPLLDETGDRMWHPAQFRREALATARRICDGLLEVERGDDQAFARVPNLLLAGPAGTGKSKLLIAMIRHLAEHRAPWAMRYKHFGALMAECRDSLQAQRRTQALINELVEVPLLALDEIGAGRATDWEQDVANDVICRRWDLGRPTWGTTNYSLERDPDPTDAGALGNRIGPQAMSRLRHRCKVLPLIGTDLRGES